MRSLTTILRCGHDHNVSAYSRRSVNAWGVVNFASLPPHAQRLSNIYCVLRCACGGRPGNEAMHIPSRAVNLSLLAGPNPSEQKPNQTNKRLACSYIAQRQQQKLGSCYFELDFHRL